mmetsp:Transcript_49897/g.159652  ORF Transcript_49897/g.159652 Transcript_49897/m.159652 type:complete len:248 (+) Transcript_49897:1037-1780(+)
MEVVVLHVPRLGQHPVEPVHHAADDALAEDLAVEAVALLVLLGVVAAVGDVVADHGPAGEDARGEEERRHGGAEPGEGPTREEADVGGEEHLLEVGDVVLALLSLDLLLNRAHLRAPRLEVKVAAPLSDVLGSLGAPHGNVVIDVVGTRGADVHGDGDGGHLHGAAVEARHGEAARGEHGCARHSGRADGAEAHGGAGSDTHGGGGLHLVWRGVGGRGACRFGAVTERGGWDERRSNAAPGDPPNLG